MEDARQTWERAKDALVGDILENLPQLCEDEQCKALQMGRRLPDTIEDYVF